jgi:hypothetical protein
MKRKSDMNDSEGTARGLLVLATETRRSKEAAERAHLVAAALARRYGVSVPIEAPPSLDG